MFLAKICFASHDYVSRNRVTAKQSRDRRAEYIRQLELGFQEARDRIAQLENELFAVRVGDMFHDKFGCPPGMGVVFGE
jgi:hypothetical protein